MKRVAVAVLIGLVAIFVAPLPAQAQTTYLDNAVTALGKGSVYVASGVPGTDSSTAGKLAAQMRSGDNITVVLLPADASGEVGTDLSGFAQKIDQALGKQRIIGLVVGSQADAYSPTMPVGTASDLMGRAESVSTNNVETLVTFIQDVHGWQVQNPQAKASGSQPHKNGHSGFFWWIPLVIVFNCGWILYVLYVRNKRRPRSFESETLFRATPVRVRAKLVEIMQARLLVHDGELQARLAQICDDINSYFDMIEDDKKHVKDFVKQLENVIAVLKKYLDIQNHPRFYPERETLMADGRTAIEDFGESILAQVRDEGGASMGQFFVKTTILSAQRSGNGI